MAASTSISGEKESINEPKQALKEEIEKVVKEKIGLVKSGESFLDLASNHVPENTGFGEISEYQIQKSSDKNLYLVEEGNYLFDLTSNLQQVNDEINKSIIQKIEKCLEEKLGLVKKIKDLLALSPNIQQANVELNKSTNLKIEKIIKEKIGLVEKRKDLLELTLNNTQETVKLNEERSICSKISKENEKTFNEKIYSKLSKLHNQHKECETIFKEFVEYTTTKFKHLSLLSAGDKAVFEEKLVRLKNNFSLYQDDLSLVEYFKKIDYGTLRLENENSYKTIETIFNEIENCYNNLFYIFLEV